MGIFQSKPVNFGALIKQIFTAYTKIFKATWSIYLLLIALVALTTFFILKFNLYVGIALAVLIFLVEIYLYAIIVHRSQNVLSDNFIDLKESMRHVNKRYLRLLGGTALFIVVATIVFVIGLGIYLLGKSLGLQVVFTSIAIVFFIFVCFLFYFLYPVIILENHGVFTSFQKSMKLFLINSWHIVGIFIFLVLVFVAIAIPVAVIVVPLHQKILTTSIRFIFNFFVYPLSFGALLVLLHDSTMRLIGREKKQ